MSEEKDEKIEVNIDVDGLLKKIDEKFEAIKNQLVKTESKGEVVPAAQQESRHRKIAESLRHGSSLREQWEAPISLPDKPTANLIGFVNKSDEIQGQMGDTVSIPVVKSFDADIISIGGSLSEKTGLYSVKQTTAKETGFYTQIPYGDIEKLSERIVAQIEEKGQEAIIRSLDRAILDEVKADVEAESSPPILDKSTETVAMDADWIAEALTKVASNGRSLKPQEFVLVINPDMYLDLYKDIAGAQAIIYARPEIVREGLVAEFIGVKILVGAYVPASTSGSKLYASLIHKDAVTFAPKRVMLFETERDTVNRKVKLTGTYTFGVECVDPLSCCLIKTKLSAS